MERATNPTVPRRGRRPFLLAAGAALALILAAAAWLLLREDGTSAGPLRARTADSVAFGARAGAPFGWGTPVIWNTGDKPAVLDRVTVLDGSPGLRVIATYVGGPDRRFLFQAESYKWPMPRWYTDLHRVAGMTVAPQDSKAGERGAELVFALQADQPGRYQASRIAVDYHVGDRRHRAIVESGLSVCTNRPPAPLRRDCPVTELD